MLAAVITYADNTVQNTKLRSYRLQRPGRAHVSEGRGEGKPQPQNRPSLCRVISDWPEMGIHANKSIDVIAMPSISTGRAAA